MTGSSAFDELRDVVRSAESVVAVGGRTHWEVGGAPDDRAVEVRAPSGVVDYDPGDLTVAVAAGTTVRELGEVLGANGQECPLDPRSPDATVGGVLATGLSGHRRLRYGPVRDRVLEVRFVTADGRLVKGGGPTVKNVSGFDLPRLLVGSLGTIGVMVQVILRCQPLAPVAEWCTTALDPFEVRRRAYRPSCIAWDGARTHVLFEGVDRDVIAQRTAIEGERVGEPPALPDGPHRGRASVRPTALRAMGAALERVRVRWTAEIGVGTVHVAADSEPALAAARLEAAACDGWLLREAGAAGLDGFGGPGPNRLLAERIRVAFDPGAKLGRGRVPNPRPAVEVDVEGAYG